MNLSKDLEQIINLAFYMTQDHGYEFVTAEVLLMAFCQDYRFRHAFAACGGDIAQLEEELEEYMEMYVIPDELEEDLEDIEEKEIDPDDIEENKENPGNSEDIEEGRQIPFSLAASQAFIMAQVQAGNSGKKSIEITHLLHAIWKLKESYAVYYMKKQGVEESQLMQEFLTFTEELPDDFLEQNQAAGDQSAPDAYAGRAAQEGKGENVSSDRFVESYAPCINDMLDGVNPLIGRKEELERTIQILCRKEKNNPLHIGEPGVGKTAITYGLARMIEQGNVPESLKGAKIYSLDLGSLLAGTQYRGDLEKRLKRLLEEIAKDKNPIIYIDEIHNLAGAGAVGEGSFDISNLLKPYLAQGKIRFIGASTFEEYKKYFEKNKSLVRRFQNVEITEPTEEETLDILKGLKGKYEKFHGVRYGKGVLEYAVRMSAKYINERFLPDKAIDLMDEAGAYRKIHPLDQKTQSVGKNVINEILTKICRVPIESVAQEKDSNLATLKKRMLSRIFGQDEAVSQVVNAIKYSRAGLLEDQKPLSSFLFAGPTGVGKTEIARTLAKELSVPLVRFDMSEYGEKHAIAKLIGSPAGYVGYEEGGLLTEAIRKNPSCVLLLDEIEKAHADIFHVLLQVMDYATLTDNQGRKADFRNVIIILTSNAGASQIGKPGIGFQKQDVTPDVISEEVKRIFQPEFRNRLNRIVVFRGMDDAMAEQIAGKKLDDLARLLSSRKVELHFTAEAVRLLRKKGSSREYGAREMDRIIQQEIKSLLVDELLYGKLKKGGKCTIAVDKEADNKECFTLVLD